MRDTQDPTNGAAGPSAGDGDGPSPLAVLREMSATISRLAEELTPERVPGHQVRAITKALTDVERGARGIRLVLRKKAADTGDWKAKGHKSPADQVAKEEGISTGQATREIEASKRLADMPEARDAAGRGEISPESATVVAEGAAADPGAESSLVKTAKRGDLQATRKRAGEVIARADERSGEKARRIYQRRALKTWVSLDGEGHGVWNIPPEMHATVMAALEPYRKAAFQAARASGEHLTDEALYADALHMLAKDILLDDHPDDTADGSDAEAPRRVGPDPTRPPAPDSPTLFDDPTHGGPADDGSADEDGAAAEGPAGTCPGGVRGDGDAQAGGGARTAGDALYDEGSGGGSGMHDGARTGRRSDGDTAGTGRRPMSADPGHDASCPPDRSEPPRPPTPPPPGPATPNRSSRPPKSPGPRVVPTGGRRPSTPAPRNRRAPAQVHVLVDFDALRRGFACDGDTCEIPGVGPIPVALAEHLMQDAILRLIVTGTDITKVTSHRRYVPEETRRALFARDKGACVVCGSTRFLELHHYVDDFAKGCPTAYSTLAHVCSREHALITHCGWTLHRTHAGWHFLPPDNPTGKDPP